MYGHIAGRYVIQKGRIGTSPSGLFHYRSNPCFLRFSRLVRIPIGQKPSSYGVSELVPTDKSPSIRQELASWYGSIRPRSHHDQLGRGSG